MKDNNALTNPAEQAKRSTVYDAKQTAEIRTSTIRNAIVTQLSMPVKAVVKTDLNDLPAVQAVAERYIGKCAEFGIPPSYEGLAAALGVSRNYAYEYPRKHPDSATTAYLENLRLGMAALRMALAESKVIDCASAIFILKNSGYNMADKVEQTIPERVDPLANLSVDVEAAKRRMETILAGLPEPIDGEE